MLQNVDNQILIDLMKEANEENEKLTIQDVRKWYQLKAIRHYNATTSIWIYRLFFTLVVVIIGILFRQFKKYRMKNRGSSVPRNYFHISNTGMQNRRAPSTSTVDTSFSGLLQSDSSTSCNDTSTAQIDGNV